MDPMTLRIRWNANSPRVGSQRRADILDVEARLTSTSR